MNYEFVNKLTESIEYVFVLIGLALLAIEILKGIFNGSLKSRGVADMLTNLSTQLPFLVVEFGLLASLYVTYFWIEETYILWSFELNYWTLLIALIVADFLYYWEHRIAHFVRILWLQHAVHHSSRHMNITTGIRFGAFEGVWSLIVLFPMLLAGFPAQTIIFGSLSVLAYQTWLHTELIGSMGAMDKIFNTPANHRVHHGCDKIYLDKNFGGILIIWDRLFGTYQPEVHTPRYGLDKDFDSVNPFKVWFSEYPAFFKDLKKSRSFREVWMRFFARPEWQPDRVKSENE